MNNLYPIFLKLEGRQCLVVGGGEVAKRKILSLLESGACVGVVSSSFDGEIVELAKENKTLTIVEKNFEEVDLEGVSLIIAATNDEETNREVYENAIKRGLLINVVDNPKLCNFYLPSSMTAGDLKIAISTAGKSPALAKKIKGSLEKQFGNDYVTVLECLGELRKDLLVKYPDEVQKRSSILNNIVNSGLIEKSAKLSKEDILCEMRKWI